jgi:hypothetical protein
MTAPKLQLEINPTKVKDETRLNSFVYLMSADAGENNWIARVRLTEKQAIVAFPKFGTVGIGFQSERDWNTNLPASCEAEEIYDHIKHNAGSRKITRSMCIEAIRLLIPYAAEWLGRPMIDGRMQTRDGR